MKLLNVRLGDEDARMAAELRQEGVQLSSVVREALRAAYEQRVRGRTSPRRLGAIMAQIYADIPGPRGPGPRGPGPRGPGPRGLAPPRYDLRDRQSIRRAIVARLRRKARA